jgi:hypothetical protein
MQYPSMGAGTRIAIVEHARALPLRRYLDLVRSERQQLLHMILKSLIFSGFDEVNVSQFASQFVSRMLVDGAVRIIGRES